MKNNSRSILFVFAILLCGCNPDFETLKRISNEFDTVPLIKPDYTGITIPFNIAPMQFSLHDSGNRSAAEISSVKGNPIRLWSKKGIFQINVASWKTLLAENRGNPLRITVYSRDPHGAWRQYKTIENIIAAEPIDRYCTYRLLNFQYNYWRELKLCQRDLTSFNEKILVNSENYEQSYVNTGMQNNAHKETFKCFNCHIPMNNDPSRFILQLRSKAYKCETLIADGDSVQTLSSQLGQPAWHPGGKYIAFSIYDVKQYFHAVGRQPIDVYDNYSYIVMYDIAHKKIISVPQLQQRNVLETWPVWSADGRYLYFCSAPVLWEDYHKEIPDNFNKTRYSLLRIAYDASRNSWGEIDTVLSTDKTGLSIAQPKISTDNRFCVFCMQNYGPYPYIDASSDLYILDIATKQYHRLELNSEYNESWHSWSKNGRWLLFSSRRGGGIFTRLYISYIDSSGHAAKPFIMPQNDPAFYDSFLKCYNVPEFAIAQVRFTERQMFKLIQSRQTIDVPVPPYSIGNAEDSLPDSWISAREWE